MQNRRFFDRYNDIYPGLDDEGLMDMARSLSFMKFETKPGAKVADFLHGSADKKLMTAAYKYMTKTNVECISDLTPSALLISEHFYLIEKALICMDVCRRDIKSASRITVASEGVWHNIPRVYCAVSTFLSHRNFRITMESLASFLNEFQKTAPFDSGELALLPDMLRAACLKQLSNSTITAVRTMDQYEKASRAWEAIQRFASNKRRQRDLLREFIKSNESTGINRLHTLLSDGDELDLMAYINSLLNMQNRSIESEGSYCRNREAAEAKRIGNVIAALNTIDVTDWAEIATELSVVNERLMRDSVYARMDMGSKEKYAQAVSRISQELDVAEAVVAMRAVELSATSEGRASNVGYFLLAPKGIAELKQILVPERKVSIKTQSQKLVFFLLAQSVFSLILIALSLCSGVRSAILSILPAWAIANAIITRMFVRYSHTSFIPRVKLDTYSDNEIRTIVLVPTLITGSDSIKSGIEKLETHYLSNPLTCCSFAILGDFTDSRVEENENEEALLKDAANAMHKLNVKYASPENPIFFYIHRKRTLNKNDGIWMGRERKRGAIEDALKLILFNETEPFLLITAPLPNDLKYCVVLDADTIMPRTTLQAMIGAMVHPLNSPSSDKYGVVRDGYGMLVPRMETTARSAAKTKFSRLITGFGGISSYSDTVGELYQDVFSEGIFGGKGIFDIRVFHNALSYKIKNNTVLSHDLLEGCFVRAGFLSDIALFDGEPSTFSAWWKRQHRWIRGDWQLIPFSRRICADASDSKHKTFLNGLSRWKISDNMRRSLTIPAVFASLIPLAFYNPDYSVFLGLTALFIEPLIDTLRGIISLPRNGIKALKDYNYVWARALFRLSVLPYEAYMSMDAIIRTLYRVYISHKKMLEWQTAAQSEKHNKSNSVWSHYRFMWFNLLSGLIFLFTPFNGFATKVLFGTAWILAPLITFGLDMKPTVKRLSNDVIVEIKELAKQIWQFFYDHSTHEYGFTPPDNVQEEPYKPPVAHASPTNIGMGLMASVCAFDLGFINGTELVARLDSALKYINSLEKWNGHLFNWYATEKREKLTPAYVSTVDSGNLAACLLCAATTLNEIEGKEASACAEGLRRIALDMDFAALYDSRKSLFHIGFDYHNGILSKSWYDLLASEARLTYLVACGLNQIPQKAWFSLGRLLVPSDRRRALISWGGTMFEYLMPVIFTELIPGTLLEETCKSIVLAQMKYTRHQGRAWGISESGYYAFDKNMYYQYRAFGIPRLGLAPMREAENVTSPYAVLLSLMVDPHIAYNGMRAYDNISARGKYGYYEAVDYTKGRVKPTSATGYEIVKSYMAHHQGMSICAINNLLNNNILQKRFFSVPEMSTVMLLTEEKLPSSAVTLKEYERSTIIDEDRQAKKITERVRHIRAFGKIPEGQMLSNGEYTTFICENGVGFSKCGDYMLTRYRADSMSSGQGVSICLKHDNLVYELAPAISTDSTSAYTTFEQHKAEFFKRTEDISCKVEVCVSPDFNAELRHITLINQGHSPKEIELGVFAEIALAVQEEDEAHPAFVRLTVDAHTEGDILIFERRGNPKRVPLYMYACLKGMSIPKYCTDRLIFPGRGKTYAESMKHPLLPGQDVQMPVEPGICARSEIMLKPGESSAFTFIMGFAKSYERAVSDCHEVLSSDISTTLNLAWAKSNSMLKFMEIPYGKAELFERIATRILLKIPHKPNSLSASSLGVEGLYRFGINMDLPIVYIEIKSPTMLRHIKTLLKLHEYTGYKGIRFRLIITGDYPNEYFNELKFKLGDSVQHSLTRYSGYTRESQIHIIDGYDITSDERKLLRQCALIIIDPGKTLDRVFTSERLTQEEEMIYPHWGERRSALALKRDKHLLFNNGIGGFNDETSEYVMTLEPGVKTPLPWSNIICNENIGTLITESGGGYTWRSNSHSGRLTPWYNDSIRDKNGEILLITDENTGETWTITPGKLQGDGEVIVRHGFGYTSFASGAMQLRQTMTVTVDDSHPVKYTLIRFENPVLEKRKLSVLYMIDWALGNEDLITEYENGVMFAQGVRKRDNEQGFISITGLNSKNGGEIEFSGDRYTTLNGGWNHKHLNGKIGIGFGGFSALRAKFDIDGGDSKEICLLLGKAAREEAFQIRNRATPDYVKNVLSRVKHSWNEKLSQLSVSTPDKSFDLLVNNRLLYQIYTSRLMGRTGYYQSGGAFGFRDQLQDVLALLHSNPVRAKGQILLCASMQFEAGDVLHWWHTPSRGVRTRIVDDRLFLPYTVIKYCKITGDYSIYDEKAPYLKDVPIPEGQDSIYFNAEHSHECGTIYEHCIKAINSALEFGAHGLPLTRGGDWNDGMDNIGKEGGESVFLAFLLIDIIDGILPAIKRRHKEEQLKLLTKTKIELRKAIESQAWDGEWYRRAYLGDGAPLGSRLNTECSIDLLSQVWAVFTNADNALIAYENAVNMLMSESNGIISLLSPPFNGGALSGKIGYIESYLPGTRENSGQYTHAAAWSVIAACMLGKDELALRQFKLINPIEKTAQNASMQKYMGEPYVLAGDVYSIGRIASRAGWTWYTGSAAWMYIAACEYILGITRRGDTLSFAPHTVWDEFTVKYKYMNTVYIIHLTRGDESVVNVDGIIQKNTTITLINDGNTHMVEARFI